MSTLLVRHVRDALTHEFAGRIDLSDIATRPAHEQSQAFLSRALAATAVRELTGCTLDEAAQAVIDGQDDNGIDAVAVSPVGPRVYLVQAKWSDNGRAGLGVDSALKLVNGFKLITDSEYSRFNARFQALANRVDEAIDDPNIAITLVVVLLGEKNLAEPVRYELDKACAEVNSIQPLLEVQVLGLGDLHRIVRRGIAEPRIDLDVRMENWSHLADPYRAYYGTMAVEDIAEWYEKFGDRLFAQNIRKTLGLTQVNRGLARTLHTNPEHFWYFNNGITVLCDSVQKTARFTAAVGGSGDFRLTGVSVVNGAQTVAAIHGAFQQEPETAGAGKVWVRLISLEQCPDDFATQVTQATNTQNQVERRDFVALDPEQARLRDDFSLSLHKTYVVKRGETEPAADAGCSVVEAAVALACVHPNADLARRAKRDSDLLWEQGPQGAYTLLFSRHPSAFRVWRLVLLCRHVQACLRYDQTDREGRAITIAVHGDLLVAYVVFQCVNIERIDDPAADWGKELAKVGPFVDQALDWLVHQVDAMFGTESVVISVFRDADNWNKLAAAVLDAVRSRRPVPELPLDYRVQKPEPTRRKANAVPLLVDAKRILDGTVLEFRPVTGPERRALTAWLAVDPTRGRATWVNDRSKPLLWAADGERYAPSPLVMHMMRMATDRTPSAVQGTSRWFVRGEGSLVELADRIRAEEEH